MFPEPTIYASLVCLMLGSLYWRLRRTWLSALMHISVPPAVTLFAGNASGYINLRGFDCGWIPYIPYLAAVPYISSLAGSVFSWCLRHHTPSPERWRAVAALVGYTYYLMWFLSVAVGGHHAKLKWQALRVQNLPSDIRWQVHAPFPFVLITDVFWAGDMSGTETAVWLFGWTMTISESESLKAGKGVQPTSL